MRINYPYGDKVNLQKSPDLPSVPFTTGSLYFTVRSSHVLDLQPHQSVDLDYEFNADCDLSIVSSNALSTSFSGPHFDDSPWRDDVTTTPFHEELADMTT